MDRLGDCLEVTARASDGTIEAIEDVPAGKMRFEILEIRFSESSRFDGNKPYPHPHVICLKCKKILDPE
jgi:hypothetical protein